MESPKLELGQGVGLMSWCLKKAQLLTGFTYDSPGKPPCQLQHSTASSACCEPNEQHHAAHSGVCLATWSPRMREGPPSCLSATLQLEKGCHPQSHPAQRRQKRRTGHIAPSHQQLHTSWDKQQSHHKLHGTLQALPSLQQLRWTGILVPFPG